MGQGKGQGGIFGDSLPTQCPQWLQYAKQLFKDQTILPHVSPHVRQPIQGLTIHVHYHGVSVGDQSINLPPTHCTPNVVAKENGDEQHVCSRARVQQPDICTPCATHARSNGDAVMVKSISYHCYHLCCAYRTCFREIILVARQQALCKQRYQIKGW